MKPLAALCTCIALSASCVQPPAAVGDRDDAPPSRGGALIAGAAAFEDTAPTGSPAAADSSPVAPLVPSGIGASRAPTAPVALTASDGTGLEIVAYVAKAVVEDPLAFTELHLTFRNPRPAQVEGQFTITLPPGAAVSRFAMKQAGGWQEGEVVELQAARQAYEDFLHRRQDPALLEKQAGNQFHARVFPIPASGEKEIIVSYSQELPRSREPYRLPLRGLPKLRSLDIRALVGKHEVRAGGASTLGGTRVANETVEVKKSDFMPDADFEVPLVAPDGGRRLGLRHDNLVVARLAPVAEEAPQPVQSLLVLVDTSASRALGFADDVERVAAILGALAKEEGQQVPLIVAAFDQEVEEVYRGTVGGFGATERTRLLERRALGASDLGKALAWAGRDQGSRRVLLVSDGVATAGKLETGELRALVGKLRAVGVERLDVLKSGGLCDEAGLHELVTAGLPHDGVVADSELGAAAVVGKLGRATFSSVHVEVPGSRWSWPETLDGMQSGDEVLIYADLPPENDLEVRLSGAMTRQQQFLLVETARPLLERAWVGARMAKLTHQQGTLAARDADLRSALRHEIVELSTKHRVLSDYTGLLVLETEWDYQRFHIDRRALSDILVVGPSGIELAGRAAAQANRLPPPQKSADPPWARHATASSKKGKSEKKDVTTPAHGEAQLLAGGDVSGESVSGLGSRENEPMGGLSIGASTAEAPPPPPSAPNAAPMRRPVASPRGMVGRGGGGGGGASEGILRLDAVSIPDRFVTLPTTPRPGTTVTTGAAGTPRATGSASMIAQPDDRRDGDGNLAGIFRAQADETNSRLHAIARDAPPRGPMERELRAAASANRRNEVVARPGDPLSGFDAVGGPAANEEGRSGLMAPARTERPRWAAAAAAASQDPSGGQAPSAGEEQSPYEGKFARVMALLQRGDKKGALRLAKTWRSEQPGDVLALIALGESSEALGDKRQASRAYGSLIDLFPSRADLRRFAGERLERLGAAGLELAVDTYRQARAQRPDHPSSHRLLAFALLRAGRAHEAFDVIAAGVRRQYPEGRFAGVERVLREDAGLIAAAWLRREPRSHDQILARLEALGATLDETPSLRFVLNWETDANDVDFHIEDGQGGHAWYASRALPSGGELYADVTTGYGPECFTIPTTPAAFPYRLRAHYYSRGPMGYGMGKLEIIEHDGHGGLKFEERPFVIQHDRAFVNLGELKHPLGRAEMAFK